jgi:hypothetical protein
MNRPTDRDTEGDSIVILLPIYRITEEITLEIKRLK